MSPVTRTVEHGEASQLPDTSWTWRRILVFYVTIVGSAILFRASERISDVQTLKTIVRYGFYTMWAGLLMYGVGATATDLAKLAAAVKTTRKETITQETARDA